MDWVTTHHLIGLPRRNKVLESYNLPRLSHKNIYEQTYNQWRNWISNQKPQNKQTSSRLDRFNNEFYQIFKELMPIFLKFFQKIEEEATILNSIYEDRLTLIAKLDKDTIKYYRPMSLINKM